VACIDTIIFPGDTHTFTYVVTGRPITWVRAQVQINGETQLRLTTEASAPDALTPTWLLNSSLTSTGSGASQVSTATFALTGVQTLLFARGDVSLILTENSGGAIRTVDVDYARVAYP
jgi:hypothetical protein